MCVYECVCVRETQRKKILTSNSILPVSPEDVFFFPSDVSFFLHNSQCSRFCKKKKKKLGNNPRTQYSKGPGQTVNILSMVLSSLGCLCGGVPDPSNKIAICFACSLLSV